MAFDRSTFDLGDTFFQQTAPEGARQPQIFLFNDVLSADLRLEEALPKEPHQRAKIFGGNEPLAGEPSIAMAYAGHQFGHFVPQLGDGRAHLIASVVDNKGQVQEIQLKGSGRTGFSRGGDGRCGLGPALREYVMSEAMHALGIPTTRSLAVVTTGEEIYRQTSEPGAIVTRVAESHLRVGSFEYFAARRDVPALERLFAHLLSRHHAELDPSDPDILEQVLQKTMDRQITLVVHWMRVGFIHGVMNTDNTALSGQTIDYGPCAMMGTYHPDTVFSSIDRQGRYAFGRQGDMLYWNLTRFAETLLTIMQARNIEDPVDKLESILNGFPSQFSKTYQQMMAKKIGFESVDEGTSTLAMDLLDQMQSDELDYTLTFDSLTRSLAAPEDGQEIVEGLKDWHMRWKNALEVHDITPNDAFKLMRKTNPLVIPRNHHMEAVIQACAETGESSAAEDFLKVLLSPYENTPTTKRYQDAPKDGDRNYQTFCGT